MITKMEFNELVENTTRYLQAYQKKINDMENKLADYERRLAHMENRRKPGPKPKAEAA